MELHEKTIGEVIRSCRLRKGITQEVLSGLADIGRSHLAEIENGTSIPTVATIWKLADALDMTASDIIAKVEEREAEYERAQEEARKREKDQK